MDFRSPISVDCTYKRFSCKFTSACYIYKSRRAPGTCPSLAAEIVEMASTCRREGIKVHSGDQLKHAKNIEVEGDEFSCTLKRGRDAVTQRAGIVKFLEPLTPFLNYYEYEILNQGEEASIGIGVGPRDYTKSRMPGWDRNSVGYHANDGKLYHENDSGVDFGPTCTKGDIMGCGVDFSSDDGSGYLTVFFTKNNKHVGDHVRMRRPPYGLYPLIGLNSKGERVKYLGHWCRTPGLQEPIQLDHSDMWLRCNGVKFLGDSTLLEYNGTAPEQIQDVGMAQARIPLSHTNNYFELKILSRGAKGAIAIGLAKSTYPMHCHLGWNPGAVGYHADNGKVFVEQGRGEPFGPTCTDGDTMGCGIVFTDKGAENEKAVAKKENSDLVVSVRDDSEDSDTADETATGTDIDDSSSYYSTDDELLDLLHEDDEPLYQQIMSARQRGDGRDRVRDVRVSNQRPLRDIVSELGKPELVKLADERMLAREKKDKVCSEDTMSCGRKCTVYFTKNGKNVGERECNEPMGGFYPIVAMLSKGEKIQVNLNPH